MCGVVDIIKHFFSNTMESIPKPEVEVRDINLKETGPQAITYLAKVNVSNPYCVPIPLGEMCYNLKSSNCEIATGTVYDTGSLKARGDTLLYVDIILTRDVMHTLVDDIMVDWDIDYEFNITLVIDLPIVCDIKIPITKAGEIKLPTVEDFFKKDE